MSITASMGTGFARMRAAVQTAAVAGMPDHIRRMRWSREQIEAAQQTGIKLLLARAIEASPFHRRRLAGIDPAQFDVRDLSNLPVMTKAEMMDSLDDVVTDPRVKRSTIEDALARTTTEPVPFHSGYTALATGGSSGRRGLYVFDTAAIATYYSSISRSLMARLQAVGGPPPGGLPCVMVGAASAVHATGAAAAWVEGGGMGVRMTLVPVTSPLPEIVERLNALNPAILFGYATMLVRLAAEKLAARLRITPAAITTTSETLTPEARAAIKEAFGVPIVDTFGSSEGLIGTTAPDDEILVFNTDLCIVELVDGQNRPVPAGVPSAKVLVTNLYNITQPLIRFVLEDTFIKQPDAAEHGHLRARVLGRADEVLHYDGIDIHPHVVRSVLVQTPEVLDYCVRQTPRGMDIDALTLGAVDRTRLADRLRHALELAGLPHPAVSVRVVDQLERNSQTGKLRRFMQISGSGV